MEKITRFQNIPEFTRSPNYRVNVSLSYLVRHLEGYKEDYNLDTDPDFQRGHVWDLKKQIAFVEYFMRGGISGREIYLNHASWMAFDKDDVMVLVDGKQRLEAMTKFLNNEIPAFGTLCKDFEDTIRHVDNTFIFSVNDLGTRAEVLQWYIDLNAGGVAHTEEEINRVKRLLQFEELKKTNHARAKELFDKEKA